MMNSREIKSVQKQAESANLLMRGILEQFVEITEYYSKGVMSKGQEIKNPVRSPGFVQSHEGVTSVTDCRVASRAMSTNKMIRIGSRSVLNANDHVPLDDTNVAA